MDKIYECNICNYKTKNSGNLSHHNKTKKHLKQIEQLDQSKQADLSPTITHNIPTVIPHTVVKKNTHLCKYCNSSFSRADSLTRHKRTCTDKYDEIYELKQKLNQSEQNSTLQTKEANHYKKEAKYYKQMLMEAGGLVKKSVSALTYSITNYDNAPPLKSIQMDDIKSFKNSNKKIVEDILSYYKHKTLSEHLGNIILAIYKKKDPLDQSVWNTDDSRFIYIPIPGFIWNLESVILL